MTLPESKIAMVYVEDDLEDQEFFKEALDKLHLNYELILAKDCKELIERLANGENYDIIFMDINLPITNGTECLQLMKANDSTNHIPIIMLSSSKSESDIERSYNSGAHFYIAKPYAHINLVASLQRIFAMDWKQRQPKPEKDQFYIDYSFREG